MNVLDLFSGIGGFSLGLERAGMRTVAFCEIDPYCRAVLRKHWPDVPIYDDVKSLKAAPGSCDVVCGGFPCQPFSSASRGRKRGTEDARFLWPEMFRVVSEARPRWVIGENVAQFDGLGLEQMVSDLEAIGYEVAPPFEIPACAVGESHRRARLWICGHTNSNGQPGRSEHAEASRLSDRRGIAGSLGADDGIPVALDRHRLRMLGNSVHPGILERIGRAIMRAEGLI